MGNYVVTYKILALLIGVGVLSCTVNTTVNNAAANSASKAGDQDVQKIRKKDIDLRLTDIKQKLEQLQSKSPTNTNVSAAIARVTEANEALNQSLANKQSKKALRADADNDEGIAEDFPGIILNSQPEAVGQRLVQAVDQYFSPGKEQAKEIKKQAIYTANELTDANILDKGGAAALSLAAHSNLEDALFLFRILAEKYMELASQKRAEAKAKSREEKSQEIKANNILNELEAGYTALEIEVNG
jgi:hypothetical protein